MYARLPLFVCLVLAVGCSALRLNRATNVGTFPAKVNLLTATIHDLQQFLANGTITSVQLVQQYLYRIERDNIDGLGLRAVIETADRTSVLGIAKDLDNLRAKGASVASECFSHSAESKQTTLSELHGIPLLVKDNINTDYTLGMNTTSGSVVLVGNPVGDATVIARLRAKGAIMLAKTNLSEFAKWKGTGNTDGWSSRGGQTYSAYVPNGNPSGSSSGSAVGTSAGWGAAALGTDTTGSIIGPSDVAALYSIRTTVGLVSRNGVIPVSLNYDTVGPMTKSTYDAALLLENMAGYDANDTATGDARSHAQSNYTQYTLKRLATFHNKTIAVPRNLIPDYTPADNNAALNKAINVMRSLGATILDNTNVSAKSIDDYYRSDHARVLATDFKVDFNAYIQQWTFQDFPRLDDVINNNDFRANVSFPPGECCQERLVQSIQTTGRSDPAYMAARQLDIDTGRTDGLDPLFNQTKADALVGLCTGMFQTYSSYSGYPLVSVPLGVNSYGEPFGMCFLGKPWSEPTLISLMAAWEANSPPRAYPARLDRKTG